MPGRGVVCVGPVSRPGALCVGPGHSLDLYVGICVGLCVRAWRSLCRASALSVSGSRSVGALPALSVAGLSVSGSVSGRDTESAGA